MLAGEFAGRSHEPLKCGLLSPDLFHRTGVAFVDGDVGFAQMTERTLQVCACGCVQAVNVEVVAKGILSGLEICQETFHNYLVFDQGDAGAFRPGADLLATSRICKQTRNACLAQERFSSILLCCSGIMDQGSLGTAEGFVGWSIVETRAALHESGFQ